MLGGNHFIRTHLSIAAAVAAMFGMTAARATPLNPDYWTLATEAQTFSFENPSVPNTGPVFNNSVYPDPGSIGSEQNTVGGSAVATMQLGFAPASIAGQATATADNEQTQKPAYDVISASADFTGSLALQYMVVGPPLPLGNPAPVDIQGLEAVVTHKSSLGGSSASAQISYPRDASGYDGRNSAALAVSGSGGKSPSRSFNIQTKAFLGLSYTIVMDVSGTATSASRGGKAGGTVSSEAFVDPYIYLDPSFVDLYPSIDPTQYSILVNSEFLNIPLPSEIPVPPTLPLFATGLGILGWLGWRKNGRQQHSLPESMSN